MFQKVKSALAEDRTQSVVSREADTTPRQSVAIPAVTPLSQPLKLRFKLSSDVVGESSVSPDVSKEPIAAPVAPAQWPSGGGHSLHKKKKKHKKEKEKKKKKKKYHDRYLITCLKLSVVQPGCVVTYMALVKNLGNTVMKHSCWMYYLVGGNI